MQIQQAHSLARNRLGNRVLPPDIFTNTHIYVTTCMRCYIHAYVYINILMYAAEQSCFCELDEITRAIQLLANRIRFILFELQPQIGISRSVKMRTPDSSGERDVTSPK